MIRSFRALFGFMTLGMSLIWDAIGFAVYILNPLRLLPIRDVSCWAASVKAGAVLRVAPSARQEFRGWAARALNDRRLGGATCHGDLLGPACRALVG